ncbi:sensor histidine kinase [Ferrimonas lipolytica]|uniref:histidine kinase n=1 Tax=Ferrimonas lipolytica TaxID=2724191 RepID=A0A6H1UAF8_9GAMM|nr:HAMP domain-containing sensor histidine kinase [Ferrimonas lipolytica]QIZ75619.1 HAMP domain-containing histidine kinase [Ferrimonas lipolytica]
MRRSLKIYLIGVLLLLGTLVSVTLSVVALKYFTGGMDSLQSHNMLTSAREAERRGVDDRYFLQYHVTRDWAKVPAEVKQLIPAIPSEPFLLTKKFVDGPWALAPSRGAFVLMVDGNDGVRRYVSMLLKPERLEPLTKNSLFAFGTNPLLVIVGFGVAGVVLFGLVLWGLMRQITQPVQRLGNWAKSLGTDERNQITPDFQYRELNGLASIIKTGVIAVQDSTEREREFLRHASHELRTPITVVRANSAMLGKLTSDANSKQGRAQQRIERAGKTMSDLVETLLWMSREQQLQAPQPVAIGLLIQELIDELDYLRQKQKVELQIDIDDSQLLLAQTPCRIVISNLIRNAFQHTAEGTVTVTQRGNELSISNPIGVGETNDVGFGLGLKLSRKLVEQYQWQLSELVDDQWHTVELTFA